MNKMTSEVVNNNLIIYFFGEIDSANVAFYKVKITDLMSRQHSFNLIMDFTNVEFIDSAGIGLILGRYNEMKLIKGDLRLFGIKADVMKIFNISGLLKIIECKKESYEVRI